MRISMCAASVPVLAKMPGILSAILDQAAAHAEHKTIDPAVLPAARLFLEPGNRDLVGRV